MSTEREREREKGNKCSDCKDGLISDRNNCESTFEMHRGYPRCSTFLSDHDRVTGALLELSWSQYFPLVYAHRYAVRMR